MPDEETIKLACPHCSQPIEAPDSMSGMETECPTCGKTVTVRKTYSQAELAAINAASKASHTNEVSAKPAHGRLRDTADVFVMLAKLSMGVFGIMLLGWLYIHLQGDTAPFSLLPAAGGVFGLALWLYMIAQLIYIRATLEK
jgi:endogenous inhibitor of DNA gyrase (YacG/DUF329 family)